ncbi:MAG: hypothetical protein COZ18_00560 [Flexibacter sp. CG_4_10_14_3_um_filter_32_15]|nr:MAG: hypothetical protein COZ18_00560 [Flexibacter sp. CG_4_10_14_3_um_filter_32_15]
MQTLKYQLGKIIGMTLLVLGSIFFVIMLSNISTGRNELIDGLLGGFALGGIPALGGFFLWRASRMGQRKFLMNKYERQILEAASQNGGHLTPTELAMKTDLTLQESKKVLETMQLEGYAELKISSNGSILFYFRELDKGDNYAESELLN